MKRQKKVISVLLTGLMVVSMSYSSITANAESLSGKMYTVSHNSPENNNQTEYELYSNKDVQYGCGLKQSVVFQHEYTEAEWNSMFHTDYITNYKAALGDSYWDGFSSRYFYEKLTDDEKVLYDALYQKCYFYLTNDDNIDKYISVPYSNCDIEQAQETVQIFAYENPQFYFLNNRWGFSYYSTTGKVLLYTYNEYLNGSQRLNETNELKNAINEYLSKVNEKNSLVDKEREIHDLIIRNTTYEEGAHAQSCLGVFIDKSAVCAG